MVLPGTLAEALLLVVFSTLCFSIWPNLFKLAGKWRFELFSFDFAAGALLLALISAYTLGTMGSDLSFSDSMLVAGRRSELMALMAGIVFALGNMLYLGTIALMGLSNGTLLTFCVFGCGLSLLHLSRGHYLAAVLSFVVLAIAALLAVGSAKAKRAAAVPVAGKVGVRSDMRGAAESTRPGSLRRSSGRMPFSSTSKGTITGVLAGLTFTGLLPVIGLAQSDELGIGAYGGLLLATVGLGVATFFLNFFFLNISLEGGKIRYSSYLSGSTANHISGLSAGVLWAAGALALYAAFTSTMGITSVEAWAAPFSGALISTFCGFIFWQRGPQPAAARWTSLFAVVLFAGGVALLLLGSQWGLG